MGQRTRTNASRGSTIDNGRGGLEQGSTRVGQWGSHAESDKRGAAGATYFVGWRRWILVRVLDTPPIGVIAPLPGALA